MRTSSGDLIRAVRGPILLIVLGLLFVAEYFGSQVPFYKTWPVLLMLSPLISPVAVGIAPDSVVPS